jgi:hypothetical protein
MSPEELALTSQQQLQWPKFASSTSRWASPAQPDMPEIADLSTLRGMARGTNEQRAEIWQRMLRART